MTGTGSKREHTDREYEAELRRLREQILMMGAQVEESIADSIKAPIARGARSRPISRSTGWRSRPTSCACACWPSASRWRRICASSRSR
jgi:hypothetical protein